MTVEEIVKTEGWKKFMQNLENISAILLLIMLVLYFTGNKDNNKFGMISTLALANLSIVCFFMGFNKFESESKVLENLFYKVYGIGLAIGFTTILFSLQHWPFPKEQMAIGSGILILISLFLGIKERAGENKNNIDWKYFSRIALALIPLAYLTIQNNL